MATNSKTYGPQSVSLEQMCYVAFVVVLVAARPNSCLRAVAQDLEDFNSKPLPPGKPFNFVVPKGLKTPDELRLDRDFQTGMLCGPHALYAMLTLSGRRVNYDDVVKRTSLGPNGASLQALKDVADYFSFPTATRKNVSPEDLRRVGKPVIVHLRSGPDPENPDRHDHYIVITYNQEQGWFSGIDTTNLLYTNFEPAFLARNMSGYCLVRTDNAEGSGTRRDASGRLVSTLTLVLTGVVVANIGVWVFHLRRRLAAQTETSA